MSFVYKINEINQYIHHRAILPNKNKDPIFSHMANTNHESDWNP